MLWGSMFSREFLHTPRIPTQDQVSQALGAPAQLSQPTKMQLWDASSGLCVSKQGNPSFAFLQRLALEVSWGGSPSAGKAEQAVPGLEGPNPVQELLWWVHRMKLLKSLEPPV